MWMSSAVLRFMLGPAPSRRRNAALSSEGGAPCACACMRLPGSSGEGPRLATRRRRWRRKPCRIAARRGRAGVGRQACRAEDCGGGCSPGGGRARKLASSLCANARVSNGDKRGNLRLVHFKCSSGSSYCRCGPFAGQRAGCGRTDSPPPATRPPNREDAGFASHLFPCSTSKRPGYFPRTALRKAIVPTPPGWWDVHHSPFPFSPPPCRAASRIFASPARAAWLLGGRGPSARGGCPINARVHSGQRVGASSWPGMRPEGAEGGTAGGGVNCGKLLQWERETREGAGRPLAAGGDVEHGQRPSGVLRGCGAESGGIATASSQLKWQGTGREVHQSVTLI